MLTLVTPPVILPVTIEETRNHFRVDHTSEDATIEGYLRAATERYDGRDGILGNCLITQTWKLTLERPTSEILIPLAPCQTIDEITYVDTTGTPRTFTAFHVSGLGGIEPARVTAASQWPEGSGYGITFTAGFGDSPEDVPAPIRQAILIRACQFYDDRDSMAGLPDGTEDHFRNYRIWGF